MRSTRTARWPKSAVNPKAVVLEKTKKEKRLKRIIRIVIFLVFLIVLINGVLRLPSLYQTFSYPFEKFPDKRDVKDLDPSFRANFLLVSYEKDRGIDDLGIASYNPVGKRLNFLFFDLAQNQKLKIAADHYFEKGGIAGLRQFISLGLFVPLDRYLAFEASDLVFTSEGVKNFYKEMKSIFFFLKVPALKQELNKTLKTDLTSLEIWRLFWQIRGAKFEEKDNIFVTKTDLTKFGQGANEALGELFIDQAISEEAAAVTIKNSSGQAGLGTKLANYLNNLGATVVSVEAGEELSKKSFLIVKNNKPYLERRLVSLLPFEKKKQKGQNFSGDMLIIIGEESAEVLTLP